MVFYGLINNHLENLSVALGFLTSGLRRVCLSYKVNKYISSTFKHMLNVLFPCLYSFIYTNLSAFVGNLYLMATTLGDYNACT